MAAKIYFPIIGEGEIEPDAFRLVIEDGTVFNSNSPDENLACGACKYVFGRNMTTRTFVTEMWKPSAGLQIVLKCHCGAQNLIRSKPGTS